MREIRADREANRGAVFATLTLIVLGVGLAAAECLGVIGVVVLVVVVPVALSYRSHLSAREALKYDTRLRGRARYAAVIGWLWQIVVYGW